MKKKHVVKLSSKQRELLQGMVSRGRESARKLARCRMLLKADQNGEGWTDRRIAEALECGVTTVEQIRKRFAAAGLEAALERRPQPPRPQKRRIDGAAEAKLIPLACSKAPDGRAHWTLELLGSHLVKLKVVESVSTPTLCRVLKKTNSSRG